MEFHFTTYYDREALTDMSRALRKTVRKGHSTRSHIFGWIVAVIGLLLLLPLDGQPFEISFKTIATAVAVLVLLFVLIKEDTINGYFALRRQLPQLLSSKTVFSTAEAVYHSSTEVGNSEFRYDNLIALAETTKFFVFIFSKSHAQVYDKSSITGGTIEAFRKFIQEITGLPIQKVS